MIAPDDADSAAFDYSLHYRTWHDDTDEHAAQMAAMHEAQLRPLLPTSRSGVALDIGCGMGFALLGLRRLGFQHVRGIDSDAAQVASCARKGLAVEQVADSRAFLAQHADEFDVIVMLEVLEHVPVSEQISLMRAVWRALRPGGRAIVTVPNASSIIAARLRYMDYTHQCAFTEHSLRFVLRNAGFDPITLVDEPMRSRPPLRLWEATARREFRKWVVRYLWRQVLAAEELDSAAVPRIPLATLLQAVALKPAAGASA